MGQYYRPLIEDENGKKTAFDNYVGNDYMMAKLMEHSWWRNPFVNGVAQILYKNPMRLAWVGDYAEDADNYENCYADFGIVEATYGEGEKSRLQDNDFLLDGKYLVNHTQKTYLDCSAYFERNKDDEGWCTNPLSLLTAIGNGLGGGDYYGINEENIGEWAWEKISVEDEIPEGYTEVIFDFYEE